MEIRESFYSATITPLFVVMVHTSCFTLLSHRQSLAGNTADIMPSELKLLVRIFEIKALLLFWCRILKSMEIYYQKPISFTVQTCPSFNLQSISKDEKLY